MNIPISLKIKVTLSALTYVLKKPSYAVLFICSFFVMSGAVIWSLNFSLLKYILLEAPISLYEKLSFFSYTYQSLFASFNSAQAFWIIVFSLLFGVNVALFIHALRHQGHKNTPKKSGSAAFTLAILAGGCAACGTSLLTPLLITLGVTSGAFIRDLGPILLWIGSTLTIYSIYKLSLLTQVPKNEKGTKKL